MKIDWELLPSMVLLSKPGRSQEAVEISRIANDGIAAFVVVLVLAVVDGGAAIAATEMLVHNTEQAQVLIQDACLSRVHFTDDDVDDDVVLFRAVCYRAAVHSPMRDALFNREILPV